MNPYLGPRMNPHNLVELHRRMVVIREFEQRVAQLYRDGEVPGFVHLSIGQEAAAVGMAFALTADDHIFGSHRSHGEILAKGLSAIRAFSDSDLLHIMRSYRDGVVFAPVERASGEEGP